MKVPLYFSAKSISMSRRGGRKPQTLLVAAKHNLRDHQAVHGARENICLALSHRNKVLHGPTTPDAVEGLAQSLKMKYAIPKRKLRKDHVRALEFVISVRGDSGVDEMAYFKTSVGWLIKIFGKEMLLSAVVHYDEAEPHMHAFVLPIIDGQYMGGEPIDKSNLPKLIKRFANEVGRYYGFSFEPKVRLNADQRAAAFNLVIDHLERENDPAISSSIWSGVLKQLMVDPQEFLTILGLPVPEVPPKKEKTSTQIFTGTGKKTAEDRSRRRTHDLSCVGQRNSAAPFSGARS